MSITIYTIYENVKKSGMRMVSAQPVFKAKMWLGNRADERLLLVAHVEARTLPRETNQTEMNDTASMLTHS